MKTLNNYKKNSICLDDVRKNWGLLDSKKISIDTSFKLITHENICQRGQIQANYICPVQITRVNEQKQYDLLSLRDMDKDSVFLHFLQKSNLKFSIREDKEKACPYKNLPASWDHLLAELSKKKRQKVGYYRRALERQGKVEFEQIDDAENLNNAFADMLILRKDRMVQKGFSSSKVNSDYQAFHAEIIKHFFDDGMLRLYFLKVDQQRVAYLYLFAGGKTLYFYQTGFDRNLQKHSVGFVLLGMVIENAIKEGVTTFEFLRGREAYKYDWNISGERQLADIFIFFK